ncbi:ABC transporter substrate-binding protein [Bacillus sp. 7884-1]|uniref:ABC transporter substrate-binding protein n=1 Tax=Bacillus sp. 7884-1 TaxID=2021693 RepID=UPI000BA713F0|nr:ABC transporter substrate-binding protein [Bacillus sp. 7884-1]PAE41150.1 ABC transporter substrate-binding protein [Bacillus sp. 7884-1]
MDHYLLTIWNSTSTGEVKVQELAEILNLSAKQTRRKLSQWQEEGWLTFQAGRGRGNDSKLQWKKDVESAYEIHFISKLESYSIEQVSKLLLFNWSTETKQRLMTKFQSKFGFHQEGQDRLIIPRFYRFLTYHPLKAADVHSANLVANIYNRVAALEEDNTITPELAHSWELTKTKLTLYLRKDVAFHDGSILKAEDVVQSFIRMKQDVIYAELWKPITKITSPASLVVELEFPNGCTYILPLLSLMTASIYKESNGQVIGTGSFYMGGNPEEKTVLHAFKHYYGERPLLDTVEFIQVSKEFGNVYYGAHESREVGTFEVESDSGFGIVVMNSYRQSDIARKEVRDYIHMLIDENRSLISTIDSRISENNFGCLIGYSKPYSMTKIAKPSLSKPLRMKYTGYAKNVSFWLKSILEHGGIYTEIEEVSFHDALYHDHLKAEADLFIHGEIFEVNQSFSYFNFIKNNLSPLRKLTQSDPYLQKFIQAYDELPFEQWIGQHLKIEKYLIENSLCIPLYYSKRQIPFSINLMNVEIKHFGYVDLSKLWMKPKY